MSSWLINCDCLHHFLSSHRIPSLAVLAVPILDLRLCSLFVILTRVQGWTDHKNWVQMIRQVLRHLLHVDQKYLTSQAGWCSGWVSSSVWKIEKNKRMFDAKILTEKSISGGACHFYLVLFTVSCLMLVLELILSMRAQSLANLEFLLETIRSGPRQRQRSRTPWWCLTIWRVLRKNIQQ